jgi:hypothetical protein
MTIFGFNTDVKRDDVVYHVQSEARQNDLLLQTLVYVKGQCVGKQTVSYAQKLSQPGFSNEAMHELLKAQHKAIIDAIQQDRLQAVVGRGADVQDVGGTGLVLKWAPITPELGAASSTLHFLVLDSGQTVSGAEVVVRPTSPSGTPILVRGSSSVSGAVSLAIPLTEDVMRDAAVIAQATHGEKSVTRKIRFKK